MTSSSSSIQTHSRSGSFDEPEEPFNGRRNISSWIGKSSEVKKKKKRIRSRLLTIDQLLYGWVTHVYESLILTHRLLHIRTLFLVILWKDYFLISIRYPIEINYIDSLPYWSYHKLWNIRRVKKIRHLSKVRWPMIRIRDRVRTWFDCEGVKWAHFESILDFHLPPLSNNQPEITFWWKHLSKIEQMAKWFVTKDWTYFHVSN